VIITIITGELLANPYREISGTFGSIMFVEGRGKRGMTGALSYLLVECVLLTLLHYWYDYRRLSTQFITSEL